jgi:aspartyl protease family protein
MSGDQTANLIYLLLILMFVASSLTLRRLPLRSVVKMAAIWIAIFGILFIAIVFYDDLRLGAKRLMHAADPEAGVVAGETLRIPMSADGHFWIRGSVNGVEARFLIDSGATTTALSNDVARSAGVPLDESGFGAMIQTASGTVMARRVRIDHLKVGPITRNDFAAISAPEFGDMNVLGMNFLSSLSGWGVEGRTLVLTP